MENRNDRIDNRMTTWHVININEHSNQTPSHYVNAFDSTETRNLFLAANGLCLTCHHFM